MDTTSVWSRTFNRSVRRGDDMAYAAYLADNAVKRATVIMHYRENHYTALCGVHRPEDVLTANPQEVTCGRCRRRVTFPQEA